ncbi:MAG: site-2 protease family protein [Candidatus Daviesbacteria bacterium]|nr:site-2 protease family protein [Candidatus Daviesbacteria bacterium]
MLISIVIFIVTLLVLVLIHEFGHFIMAKRFGIKVEEFGFGIPPRLWGKKIGETIYSLNWLPFGGFVRLLGEDEESSSKGGKSKVPVKGSRDFRAKPVGQRIIVVVAGVTMNLVLAWILFYTVIISQNFKIIYPTLEPAVYIAKLEQNFPAQKAGLKVGERLISIDDKEVKDIEEARKLIRAKGEQPLSLKLSDSDGNNLRTLEVTPKKSPKGDALIGVVFSPIPFREYSTPAEKIFSGITYSWDLTKLTFVGLGSVFKELFSGNFGQVSKSIAGPVGLAVVTNEILSSGWAAVLPFLWFIGVISLTLAIFNVLPIPALDGGRLLFLVVEAVIGKRVRGDIERVVHQVGFIILLALALLITFSDIRKLLP